MKTFGARIFGAALYAFVGVDLRDPFAKGLAFTQARHGLRGGWFR